MRLFEDSTRKVRLAGTMIKDQGFPKIIHLQEPTVVQTPVSPASDPDIHVTASTGYELSLQPIPDNYCQCQYRSSNNIIWGNKSCVRLYCIYIWANGLCVLLAQRASESFWGNFKQPHRISVKRQSILVKTCKQKISGQYMLVTSCLKGGLLNKK